MNKSILLNTEDGGRVTDHEGAFELASRLVEDAGFERVGSSDQSRSIYLARPDHDSVVIRVSDHANHHPGRNRAVIEARLTLVKEAVITTWIDEVEGEIEERDYIPVIKESPAEIEAIMKQAIADYDALLIELADEEEESDDE
jgi:hypothetical protein